MKRLISLLLCFTFLVSPLTVKAQEKTVSTEYYSADLTAETQEVSANVTDAGYKSAILMEKETGKVLFESNPHQKLAPASITKIMSLLLIMEAIDKDKLTLKTKITASAHACSMGGSQIWLKENEVMTVDELLRATVIASANDATVALAEAVSGSEDAFVVEMNKKAKELGLKNTSFKNCSGLDAEGHYSSAYDIAVMSCALLKYDLIKKYTTVWMDSLRDGASELVNTNKLVRFFSGATGLKTGTTSSAGFCVSGTAERDGMELCAVIMGAENNDGRFGNAKKLLEYGFANWKIAEVKVNQKELSPVAVEKGCEDSIAVVPAGVGKYLLKKDSESEIKIEPQLKNSTQAPVAKGQKLGTAKVMLDGKKIGSIDLVASKNVNKFTYILALDRIVSALLTL